MAAAQDRTNEVLRILVDNKILSSAQADLARADMEIMGMSIDEVLLARRWVTEDKLNQLVPWLSETRSAPVEHPQMGAENASGEPKDSRPDSAKTASSAGKDTTNTSATQTNTAGESQRGTPANTVAGTDDATFEDNLDKYRELMDRILGDANS